MEISEDAHRAEVNQDELVDSEHAEDEDETGVHVYLKKIQEEEVGSTSPPAQNCIRQADSSIYR